MWWRLLWGQAKLFIFLHNRHFSQCIIFDAVAVLQCLCHTSSAPFPSGSVEPHLSPLCQSRIAFQLAVNCLHHLRTFLTSMHDCPYTYTVSWQWISTGLTPFAVKNWTWHCVNLALGGSVQFELYFQGLPTQDWASQWSFTCLFGSGPNKHVKHRSQ